MLWTKLCLWVALIDNVVSLCSFSPEEIVDKWKQYKWFKISWRSAFSVSIVCIGFSIFFLLVLFFFLTSSSADFPCIESMSLWQQKGVCCLGRAVMRAQNVVKYALKEDELTGKCYLLKQLICFYYNIWYI